MELVADKKTTCKLQTEKPFWISTQSLLAASGAVYSMKLKLQVFSSLKRDPLKVPFSFKRIDEMDCWQTNMLK